MPDSPYEALAAALDRLPNRFPRTALGVEVEILKMMYAPEEAAVGAALTNLPQSPAQVAAAAARPEDDVQPVLSGMLRRGLVWPGKTPSGESGYRLAPFLIGAYEAQLPTIDHQLAHLVEEYFNAGGLAGIMEPGPALHRVVPVRGAVKSEWIMPYDELRPVLAAAQSFTLRDCICRKQQALVGEPCRFPLRTCLGFSDRERPAGPAAISRAEALELLDEAERLGLVHTVSNLAGGLSYVCNCCGCCCGILRGITDFGIGESVAHANYYASVQADLCSGCGLCTERCQVAAVKSGDEDETAVVDRARCIGCGLCVTTCPTGAMVLHLKPEDEIVHPPADFGTWERERERRRGAAAERPDNHPAGGR